MSSIDVTLQVLSFFLLVYGSGVKKLNMPSALAVLKKSQGLALLFASDDSNLLEMETQ